MVLTQHRSKRKASGGRLIDSRGKRLHEMGRAPSMTKVAPKTLRKTRTKGGNKKVGLLNVDVANLFDPKTKKYEKVKILSVVENPANRHYVRRNIVTKGCVVETEKGKAKVTSRPGQEGSVSAVLM